MENLESQETQELIAKVKDNPKNYVLKPLSEGGGHNFYGDEIIKQL